MACNWFGLWADDDDDDKEQGRPCVLEDLP